MLSTLHYPITVHYAWYYIHFFSIYCIAFFWFLCYNKNILLLTEESLWLILKTKNLNLILFQNAITWTTDGANAGTVNFRNEKFYSTNVNGVLLQKKIKPDLLTADLLNLVAFKYVSKVGNPKLMNNTMANIRIKIPSNTNARIFYSKILNKCDTKIDFINKKIDYLTTFKRFLLQNMFI